MSETDNQWYYARNNQQLGPVSIDTVRNLLATGELRPADLVWKAGLPNWQPAESMPELQPPAAPPPPQQAPFPPPGGPFPQQGGLFPQQPNMPPPPSPGGPFGQQPPFGQQGPFARPGMPVGYAPVGAPSQHGKAVGAFVCSLLGLLCLGFILGVVAIVLSTNAQAEMKRTGNFEGQGLAKAAFIIGIIDVIAWAGVLMSRIV